MTGSWDLDIAAAMLRADTADTDALMDVLGNKLERILGRRVEVRRSRKRVSKIVLDAGGSRLEAVRGRGGATFSEVHVVRNITLRTTELPADEWLDRLVALVQEEAGRSSDVRAALGRLLE